MNENAERWVETLRSGEYEQTTGSLRSNDKFCCLGVACDLYDESGWEDCHVNQCVYRANGVAYDVDLPLAVRTWLGLRDEIGTFELSPDEGSSLEHANDGGATFEEIADLIEKYQDQLFVGNF